MKRVEYSKEKSKELKRKRGVGFEEITKIINKNGLVEILEHTNKEKYPNQRMFLVKIKDYIFVIPFVEDEDKIFLKTIFPSRKFTKQHTKKP